MAVTRDVDENLTEIVAILDRSGSMISSIDDVIGGFNEMVKKQKKLPGECHVTLVIFDDEIETLYEDVPISKMSRLTRKEFFARNWTRLADAIGTTIDNMGRRYDAIPCDRRPGKVVVFVSTDGHENASKEYTTQRVREMVTHQRDKYQWNFIFTGANIDSYDAGAAFGVLDACTMNYASTGPGTAVLYSVVSQKIGDLRSGAVNSANFSADEKQQVEQHVNTAASNP